MGARLSVAQQTRARTHSSLSSSSSGLAVGSTSANGTHLAMGNSTSSGATTSDVRLRSRSVGELVAGGHVAHGGGTQGDSDSSADEITSITAIDRLLRMPNAPHSFTVSTLRYLDFKCPVCHKVVPSDDVECHLVMCLTRPRVVYNEEILTEARGECVICFEELNPGDMIARLPCLCIYHKECIDSWFKVKNSCPEHPGDD